MIDLRQNELHKWQRRNFGQHPDDILKCALGMAEETGEVCHHVLKGKQGIRESIDGMRVDETADGVADTLIYGIQLLSFLDRDAEAEIAKVIDRILHRDWQTDKVNGLDKPPVKRS